MVTYTTATKVKNELENYDTSITDSKINQFIEHAEGLIDCTMGESLIDNFNSNKSAHRLIEFCATKLALVDLIKWDLANQFGSSVGGIQLDLAKNQAERCLTLLSDKKVIKFIKGETH